MGDGLCQGEAAEKSGQRHFYYHSLAPNRTELSAVFVVLLLFFHIATVAAVVTAEQQQQRQRRMAQMPTTTGESIRMVDEANREFVQSLRIRALQNLQRSLESLSSLTANSLMLNAALQPSSAEVPSDEIWEETEKEEEEEEAETEPNSLFTTADHSVPLNGGRKNGILRIKADLKEMPPLPLGTIDDFGTATPIATTAPAENDEHAERSPSKRARHLRSAAGRRHHHQHNGNHHKGGGRHGGQHEHGTTQQHRRRRKGCPTVQGKDQLLCPTRSSQRYDVCITRDQLCDRQRDCPGGEDEDPRHCFFYRPLEHSLKTISHAVLLLVDTVMREQEEQQQRQRNEL